MISLFCALALILSLNSVAFAMEADTDRGNANVKSYSTYQEVLDMLNKEYGTNVHFPSAQECRDYGIATEAINMTLEEFEAQMRKDIEANLQANAEAQAAAQKMDKSLSVESGSGVCRNNSVEVNSAYLVTQSKDVPGATVHLRATVNDDRDYWRYSSISTVYTTYQIDYNSAPAFGATSYTYDLVDSRRTCALSLRGYTLGTGGAILDNNAYRYVEIWAGRGM